MKIVYKSLFGYWLSAFSSCVFSFNVLYVSHDSSKTYSIYLDHNLENSQPSRPMTSAWKNECYKDYWIARTFIESVNQVRTKGAFCGGIWRKPVKPVQWDRALCQISTNHSRDMMRFNFFSHKNPLTSKNLKHRLEKYGYSYSKALENISAGYDGRSQPEQVHSAWMKSSGHCKNIMNPNVTHVGVGKVSADSNKPKYDHYWTQVFAKPIN